MPSARRVDAGPIAALAAALPLPGQTMSSGPPHQEQRSPSATITGALAL